MINFKKLSAAARITQKPNVLFNTLDSETVLLNLETGLYFSTNIVGSEIWEALAKEPSIQEVKNLFLNAFAEVPETAYDDFYIFLEEMYDSGLVELKEE